MTNILFYAHSGLRHLVLLVGIIALLYFAVGLFTRRAYTRPARILSAVYTGLLHLQILLGIVLVVTGIYYPALIGHIFLMLIAVAAAQGLSIFAKRSADDRRKWGLSLAAVVVSLALILAGISAIGRSPFGSSGRPSVAAEQ